MRNKVKSFFMKASVKGLGTCLMALAILFAQAPCRGELYEPEVPEALRR